MESRVHLMEAVDEEKLVEDQMSVNQYLTFSVDDDQYALSVANIREVLEFQSVTRVPRMPDYMRGIINLRGFVVPVIDLKMKFGLGQTARSVNSSVIVTEILLPDRDIVIGLLTDAVSEVIVIESDEIEPAPSIGTSIDSSFIQGMGKKQDQFIIILNIDSVLSSHEITDIVNENRE